MINVKSACSSRPIRLRRWYLQILQVILMVELKYGWRTKSYVYHSLVVVIDDYAINPCNLSHYSGAIKSILQVLFWFGLLMCTKKTFTSLITLLFITSARHYVLSLAVSLSPLRLHYRILPHNHFLSGRQYYASLFPNTESMQLILSIYFYVSAIFYYSFDLFSFRLFSSSNIHFMFRCPMGSRAYGAECHDINECLEQFPCLNGGICKNFEDDRMFMCQCPRNYSGTICESEMLPAGILTTSTDFIIALIICILVLLSKWLQIAFVIIYYFPL